MYLDGSASYITGGDGKGNIVKWYWTQTSGQKSKIVSPKSEITQTSLQKGYHEYVLQIWDNLNKTSRDTLRVKIP